MFLQQIPAAVRVIMLFLIGAGIGSLINLAIYQLAIFNPRRISPWSPPADPLRTRAWHHRIPILGWTFLHRESKLHGRGFWIRPLLIELAWAIGLVWFYYWQVEGGLFGSQIGQLARRQADVIDSWTHTWFLFHGVLLALLTIATFIDFDEKTIPDWITIPGTLFALLVMILAPHARLPTTVQPLGRMTLEPLTYWAPGQPTVWHLSATGVGVAVAIMVIWCFALLPKLITFRYGWLRGLKLMWASVIRPARRTTASTDQKPRQMDLSTKVIFSIGVCGVISIVLVKLLGGASWDALVDSLLGLAMGGGIVWSVRIIASYALGTEAMGFGDVTLMCMVGAFLGWQPALLIFVIAPFTSIFVALIMLFTTGEQKLAFGPYLCLSTLIVIIGWHAIWKASSQGVFQLGGGFLLIVIIACLVLMAIMLGIWAIIKNRSSR